MSNTCTASMQSVNTSANYTKKTSLWDRFKKYLLDNNEIILSGIVSMNGGTYIPRKYER